LAKNSTRIRRKASDLMPLVRIELSAIRPAAIRRAIASTVKIGVRFEDVLFTLTRVAGSR
jgi:hypothetical protein